MTAANALYIVYICIFLLAVRINSNMKKMKNPGSATTSSRKHAMILKWLEKKMGS